MADTYRGLTVRIGGDATSLQKALQTINSAISTTDTQLRKMKQALSFDDTDITALSTSLDLVGQRAMETATRLSELKSSLQQLGSETVEIKFSDTNIKQSTQTLQELADATEDAGLRAAEALQNYNKVDAQLASLKNQIDSVKDGIEELEGVGSVQEILDAEGSLDSLRGYSEELDALIDKYDELVDVWKDAFTENEIAKEVKAFQDLTNEITKTETQLTSLSERFVALASQTLNVRLNSDIATQLEQIDTAAANVSDELSRMDKALELDSGNVEAAAIKLRDLKEAADLSQEKLDLLNSKLDEMDEQNIGKISDHMDDLALATQKAQTEFEEATTEVMRLEGEIQALRQYMEACENTEAVDSEEYRQAQVQVSALNDELSEAVTLQQQAKSAFETTQTVSYYREVQADVAATKSELSDLNEQLDGMTSSVSVSNEALLTLGVTLTATVTPALVSVGKSALEAADEIDSAYRDMRKTVNGTEEDFEALKEAAMEFASTSVVSADQILSIQAIGGELGLAVDALDTFAETVANLSIATDLDVEDAAEAMGTLANIMDDLTEETMPNFADALVRLGNNGASTESDIADIASRIGSMGSILGFTTPQILAWASTIASTGQNAEAAGTAISNTMSDIEVAVATGGDALDAFAEVAQMSSEEFAAAWESDPSSVMQAFVEGLIAVEESGGSATATLSELGITSTRQVQAIEGLMQTIDQLDDNLEMSQNAWEGVSDQWGEAGDAANEASAKAEGLSGQLDILSNIAQNIGAEFGEAFLPFIELVTEALQALYDVVSGLPDGLKDFIIVIGGLSAAAGPLVSVVGGVSKYMTELSTSLKSISTAKTAADNVSNLSDVMSSASGTSSTFSTALSGVATVLKGALKIGTFMAVVYGIGLLVSAITEAVEAQENFEAATEGMLDAAERTVGLDGLQTTISDVGTTSSTTAMEVDELTESLAAYVETMNSVTESAETEISQLSTAQQIINQYAGQTDLTAEAQGRLEWAIALVNEQLGLSITTTDVMSDTYKDAEGNVSDLTDTINALIEAKKREIQLEAYTANLTTAYEAQADAAATLAQAQADYNAALEAWESLDPSSWNYGFEWLSARSALSSAGDDLTKAQEAYESAASAVSLLEGQLGSLEAASSDATDAYGLLATTLGSADYDLFSSQLDVAGTSFSELSDDLRTLGADTEEFSELTSEQLALVAEAYDGTLSSLFGILDELGVSMDETASATAEGADLIYESLMALGDGSVAEVIEGMGISVRDFSNQLSEAGVTWETVTNMGAQQFEMLAERAGGDLELLMFMIENYNSATIVDKDGNITIDDTVLLYAQGEVYTWNGTELLDKEGRVVIQDLPYLVDANDEIVTWNESGELVYKETGVSVDSQELTDALGNIYTWDSYSGTLTDIEGNVIVGQLELTDALGNVVELEGHDSFIVSGDVYCSLDELEAALSEIRAIEAYDGTVLSTSFVDIVTRYYTQGSSSSGSSSIRSTASGLSTYSATPQVLSASGDGFTGTQSLLAAREVLAASDAVPSALSSVASALSSTGSLSRAASRLAAGSVARVAAVDGSVAARSVSGGVYIENQNFETKVVRADEDLYAVAPINYRTAMREARLMSR